MTGHLLGRSRVSVKRLLGRVAVLVLMAPFALGQCVRPPETSGLAWPPDQVLPTFASFDQLDVVTVSNGVPDDEVTAVVTLQGLVNRARPRVFVRQSAEEGDDTWLRSLTGVRLIELADHRELFRRYRSEITGMVVYDPAQPDTINLATTVAGVHDGVVVSPRLAGILADEPYTYPILADLSTHRFASRLAVYQYAKDEYWSQTTHRLIVGLDPAIEGSMRDYAVATKAMVIWLDPRAPDEQALLEALLDDMPINAPFLGYFPKPERGGEQVHVRFLSEHAKPVFPFDYFHNATVFGGRRTQSAAPRVPPEPALDHKIYVCLILSDGDNLQYNQHRLRVLWDDPNRGQVPIGWTINPALLEVAPNILDYYWNTATPNDTLVAGPSGMGYTYPNHWPSPEALREYARMSNRYLELAGLRVITIWDDSEDVFSETAGQVYVEEMPGLLGVTHQTWADLSLVDGQLPQTGLHPAYSTSEAGLVSAIRVAAGVAGWLGDQSGSSPAFIAAQASAWRLSPTNLTNVAQALEEHSPHYVFVRPDHFFMLARKVYNHPAEVYWLYGTTT